MNRRSWYLGAGLIGLGCLLGFALFELKEVPDVKWSASYDFNSKEPFGAWVFRSLLTEHYPAVPIVRQGQDTLISDINSSGNLYVLLGKDLKLGSEITKDLITFATKGNDVLLIGETVELGYNPYLSYIQDGFSDTMTVVSFDQDTTDGHTFTYYRGDFSRASYKFFHSIIPDSSEEIRYTTLATMKGGHEIFTRTDIESGSFYCYSIPIMFSNMASMQGFYLSHFNDVFHEFSPTAIIVDQIHHHRRSNLAESPLQFILSQKSLKAAYWLLIFAALLFVIFGGKRKQRAIPAMPHNENSTLEYVQVISNLYQQQDQHKKLVPHLEQIFRHRMYTRYYLQGSAPDFVEQLARKSQVPKEEIQHLVDDFDRANNKPYLQAANLKNLYDRLELFYSTCK